jgi:hypothetical protein
MEKKPTVGHTVTEYSLEGDALSTLFFNSLHFRKMQQKGWN